MFNGWICFEKIADGYKVFDVVRFSSPEVLELKLTHSWPELNSFAMQGQFNFDPIKGHFCKRPHKLINWSK